MTTNAASRARFMKNYYDEICVWRTKVANYRADVHRMQVRGATPYAIEQMLREVTRAQQTLDMLEKDYQRIEAETVRENTQVGHAISMLLGAALTVAAYYFMAIFQ